MEFKIKKGTHYALPFSERPWVKKINAVVTFSEESKYSLDHTNQGDWNKLTGISFNRLNPTKNAILIGWRYNPTEDVFEVAPYLNINGRHVAADSTSNNWEISKSRIEESVWIYIGYDKIQINNWTLNVSGYLKTNFLTSYRIQPWFGGDSSSPHDIEFNLKYL